MHVAIVYNEPQPSAAEDHWLSRSAPGGATLGNDFRDASEYGVLDEIRVIERAIREAGHSPRLFAVDDAEGLTTFLAKERPEVVFNCCESFRGVAALEMSVAGVYELFGIPYTGSPALTLGVALNKGLAKALFRAHGVPTPQHQVFAPDAAIDPLAGLAYPLIVKPIAEDASIGIDAHAVVGDREGLVARVRFVWREFRQAALVEEFIDGRELNVGLLARAGGAFTTLPISEIPFDRLPAGMPSIVSYDAKWVQESPVYKATTSRCPAQLSPALEQRVRAVALEAARAVGLRDYGRIDMRLRPADEALFVLEANPNPDLFDEAGFMKAAMASGRTVASTVQEILACAIDRAARTG